MIDKLDLQILEEFYSLKKGEEKTLYQIGKTIFSKQKKSFKDSEYHLIKRRIKKMAKQNLFQIVQNSPTKFILNLNSVFIKKFTFPTRRRKGMAVLVGGKYLLFEL